MADDGQHPPGENTRPEDAKPGASAGIGSQVGRSFGALAARVRDALPKAGEEDFRALADTIPQLAWAADADGRAFWYNKRWYDYTGATSEQMQGRGWHELLHPDHVGHVAANIRRAFETGEAWEDTFPLRGKDGRYRWFLSRAEPLRDAEGTVVRWYGTNTDVTEQRAFEAELAATKQAAEDANRAKSDFIASMSHELRTPLSAIIGYAEMLQEEVEDGAEAGDMLPDLRKIEANARHLLSLINDVLDLSKVESGKMEVYAEGFDAGAMVRELADTAQSLMEKKGNVLRLEVGPGLGSMHSDVTKLRQVLLNLPSNAAKFTEGGTITFAAGRGPGPGGSGTGSGGRDWLTFRVADTGLGMTEEQLGKLFRRFEQADASTTRKFGGTGLVLALTKALSAMLGGDVDVQSAPGEGSTLTVRLPAEVPTGEQPAAGDGVGGAAPPSSAHPVLVIDDDPAVPELMTRFLRREGFAVRTAADGEAGLRLAREVHPCVVLTDVAMPRLDGWGVLRALRADPALSEVPAVVATFADERALGHALGAAGYLHKPVEWRELKALLDRLKTELPARPVLVVDDDADARARLCTRLSRAGWTVAEAENGRAALERVAQSRPELVLLDLEMPELDGFGFLRELRANPDWASIPVVVVTAKDVTPAERERLKGQAARVIQKGSAGMHDLLAAVRKAAGHSPPAAAPPADGEATVPAGEG